MKKFEISFKSSIDNQIVKMNSYKQLSNAEQIFIFNLIELIDSDDKDDQKYLLSMEEFCGIFNISDANLNERDIQVHNCIFNLLSNVVEIHDDRKKDVEILTYFISSININESKDMLVFSVPPIMKAYYLEMKKASNLSGSNFKIEM